MDPSKNRILVGPIGPTIIRLSIPTTAGLVGISLVNLVDAYYLGQLDYQNLAAVGLAIPLIMIFSSLAGGLSMGTSTLISHSFGKNNLKQAESLLNDSILLVTLCTLIALPIAFASQDTYLGLLGARAEVKDLAREYLEISLLGQLFLGLIFVGNGALRASGDTTSPGAVLFMAAGVNAIVDYLLVTGNHGFPALGIRGAALASLCGWLASGTLVYGLLLRRHLLVPRLPRNSVAFMRTWRNWCRVVQYGLPATLSRSMLPTSTAVLMGVIASQGSLATAAYTVASRIESLFMLAGVGIALVMNVFIGQNLGAGNYGRVRKGLRFSLWASVFCGLTTWTMVVIFGSWIARLFTNDPGVANAVVSALSIIPIGLAGRIYISCASASCTALNKPIIGAALPLVHAFALILPFVWLGSVSLGYIGVLIGLGASGVLGIPLGLIGLGLPEPKFRLFRGRS